MKLSEQELTTAYDTLAKVAAILNADCSLVHRKADFAGGWVGIVMIRSRSDAVEALEIRVACIYRAMFSVTDFARHWKCRRWEKHFVGYSMQLRLFSLSRCFNERRVG